MMLYPLKNPRNSKIGRPEKYLQSNNIVIAFMLIYLFLSPSPSLHLSLSLSNPSLFPFLSHFPHFSAFFLFCNYLGCPKLYHSFVKGKQPRSKITESKYETQT